MLPDNSDAGGLAGAAPIEMLVTLLFNRFLAL